MSTSKFSFLNSKFDLSRGLDSLRNVTGLRSEMLIMGTLLSWIMRPQPELRMAVERYAATLGFGDNHGSTNHRHVAMHLRRGDKYSLSSRHMHNYSWRAATGTFVAWGQRLAADIGAERVLFMTDDPDLNLEQTAGNLFRFAPAPRDCMPSILAASTARAVGGVRRSSHTSAAKGLHTVSKSADLVAAQMKGRESELATSCGPSILMDDGIQLFGGILIMAHCAAFIGTQISNIGGVVVELMATLRHPPIFRDVLNDMHRAFLSDERVWYGGIHAPQSIRPLHVERLMLGNGSVTPGSWMEATGDVRGRVGAGGGRPGTWGGRYG